MAETFEVAVAKLSTELSEARQDIHHLTTQVDTLGERLLATQRAHADSHAELTARLGILEVRMEGMDTVRSELAVIESQLKDLRGLGKQAIGIALTAIGGAVAGVLGQAYGVF